MITFIATVAPNRNSDHKIAEHLPRLSFISLASAKDKPWFNKYLREDGALKLRLIYNEVHDIEVYFEEYN